MTKKTKWILYGIIAFIVIILLRQKEVPTSSQVLWTPVSPLVKDKLKLIDAIRANYRLLPITAYHEIILDSVKPAGETLIIASKATCQAGIDLRLINDADIYIEDDSIAIQLPPSEIIDIHVDPSAFRTIAQKGAWTNEEMIVIQSKAKQIFEKNIQRKNLLGHAEIRGRSIVESVLRTYGYKRIMLF